MFADSMKCPLTLEVMQDPVQDNEGNTWERTAIEAYLGISGVSPLSRNPMSVSQLISNRALRNATEERRAEVDAAKGSDKVGEKTSSDPELEAMQRANQQLKAAVVRASEQATEMRRALKRKRESEQRPIWSLQESGSGREEFFVGDGVPVWFGRHPKCGFVIINDMTKVSGRHCVFKIQHSVLKVKDASSNGTFRKTLCHPKWQQLVKNCWEVLHAGDRLCLGSEDQCEGSVVLLVALAHTNQVKTTEPQVPLMSTRQWDDADQLHEDSEDDYSHKEYDMQLNPHQIDGGNDEDESYEYDTFYY